MQVLQRRKWKTQIWRRRCAFHCFLARLCVCELVSIDIAFARIWLWAHTRSRKHVIAKPSFACSFFALADFPQLSLNHIMLSFLAFSFCAVLIVPSFIARFASSSGEGLCMWKGISNFSTILYVGFAQSWHWDSFGADSWANKLEYTLGCVHFLVESLIGSGSFCWHSSIPQPTVMITTGLSSAFE